MNEKKQYTKEQVLEAMELLPSLWIQKYKIKNESGNPIEFDDHYFMKDMYNDMSQFQVWLKPPQIGATVAQIIKTLYCAKKKQWDIVYTLPTQSDVSDMAGGKINRLIAQNPILREWVRDHDSIEQKSVGKQIIYYRGTFSTKAAMMVSSDLNVHDEVDASDAGVIQQYETRLQAKADGKRWYFSHPSISGFGVDIYWQQSDKKEWYITCPTCNGEQQLTWPANVNVEKRQYICSLCKAVLPDAARKKGKWKATDKGIFSGYHISQLMCSWISAEKIVYDFENKDEQYFYNYVLGLPYVSSSNKIDPSVVLANVREELNDQSGPVVIGVDTGLPIHYVCMNRQGVFYYNKCKPPSADYDPYRELEGLLHRWPKSFIVADQGGDLIGIRRLQAQYPGRVFLCHYRKDRKSQIMIKWGEDKEYGMVVVDRNRMITLMVDQLRDKGRLVLSGKEEDFKELASHFGNIYREAKETPFGMEYEWKRNGPDHFVHSWLYALVGIDKYNLEPATVVSSGTDDFWAGVPEGRIF